MPLPGFEPGTTVPKTGVISVSPQGHVACLIIRGNAASSFYQKSPTCQNFELFHAFSHSPVNLTSDFHFFSISQTLHSIFSICNVHAHLSLSVFECSYLLLLSYFYPCASTSSSSISHLRLHSCISFFFVKFFCYTFLANKKKMFEKIFVLQKENVYTFCRGIFLKIFSPKKKNKKGRR